MKKLLSFLMIVSLVMLCLVSCGKTAENKEEDNTVNCEEKYSMALVSIENGNYEEACRQAQYGLSSS